MPSKEDEPAIRIHATRGRSFFFPIEVLGRQELLELQDFGAGHHRQRHHLKLARTQ